MSANWKRDGTIVGPEGTEIDIRTDAKGRNWITVKGVNDAEAEKIASLIVAAPNVQRRLKALSQKLKKMGSKAVSATWVRQQLTKMLNMMEEET